MLSIWTSRNLSSGIGKICMLYFPGLASQKLSSIFSSAFLVPLEETDNHFKLEVTILIMFNYTPKT